MTLRLLPDVELLVVRYLQDQADVHAVAGGRVYTGLPPQPQPTWPLVTVIRLGGSAGYPHWLDEARVQIDSWGDGKDGQHDAFRLAAIVRAALQVLPQVDSDLGVVTAVDELGGPQYLPDPTYTPARPRYVQVVNVLVHPIS